MRELALLGLAVALVAGCQRKEAPSSGEPQFAYARITTTDMPVPARFSAPLPTSLAEFERVDRYPPAGQFEMRLCSGSDDAQQKLLAALHAASANAGGDALDEKLETRFVNLFGFCNEEALCGWVARALPKERPAVQRVLWRGGERCRSDDFEKLIEVLAPSAEVVVDHAFASAFDYEDLGHRERRPRPLSAAFQKAALKIAVGGDRHRARKIGVVLGNAEPKAAFAFAKTLQAQAAPKQGPWFAIGFRESPEPEARALFAAACREAEVVNDAMCPVNAGESERPASFDEAVRDGELDVMGHVQKGAAERAAVVAALSACVGDRHAPDFTRRGCLERLATIDRPVALAAAKGVKPAADSGLADVTSSLIRFSEVGALRKQLAAWKLMPESAGAEVDAALTADNALASAGRLLEFDVETGTFPNEHDVLLARLARFAGSDLDGVLFEEVPPPDDDGPYRIHAYLGNKRYQAEAQNLGDWYDLDTVLGLLNSTLRERGSEIRYVSLPTGDQMAKVIAGPATSLVEAHRQGVLRTEAPDQAAETGKEFEERVLEQLRSKGANVPVR
jgi:hypothetical protein